jgi:eukaryotic-like serine/threonine-protein kinase
MSEELNKLEQLFQAALDLASPVERAEYLARACGVDTALRQRVEKLLRAHDTAGLFLDPETPSVQSSLPFSDLDLPPSEKPGDQIGHYTLVERIGEGGCSVVYLAEQLEPVRRPVALKLIKAGMDTWQVVARFEVERQALALMDHPHIAKVFDAGVTTTGRPYFVMELLRGVPITHYCDQHRLTVKQRLELFVHVCQAVQHAHQKGIIHRDLKPSNILVTTADQPSPKIIDFGIAKAMQVRLTDRAIVTWFGQFVGTPAYMSPEQARMSTEDIDARTDIYALGVLLYELLTGATPFNQETLATAAFDDIRRMIQETEPPKPSARLAGLGQELADVAKHRQSEPGVLRRSLRGDLDWIVMKALEKDRQRRYATANELAEDIQRHLAHEPVLAGPPGAGYRMRKFVRRNRVGAAVGVAVTLALVAGLLVALVGLQRALHAETAARRERDRAVQAEADARRMLELFSDKLVADDELIALLHTAARLARERLGPTNPATLSFVIPLAPNFGRLGAWTSALELYLSLLEADPGNSDYWQCAHAAALAAGQPDVSRRLRQRMVDRFAASQDLTNRLRLAAALLLPPEGQPHQEIALECARQAARARPNDALCHALMGMAEYRRGNWAEALKWLQQAERSEAPNVLALAYCFGAMARQRLGQTSDAWEALSRASRQLRVPLEMGQLLAKNWQEVVFGFVARAEAEQLVWGREVSPRVTAELLEQARAKWKSVREPLVRGEGYARQGRWKESRDAYVEALGHPSFDWGAAEQGSPMRCLSLHMGIAFARSGDSTNHARLCQLLLSLHPEKPMTPDAERDATARTERYAKTCFLYARGLAPELRQGALELARFAVANQHKKNNHHPGWTRQTGGIAEYYAGDPEQAMEWLQYAEKDTDPFLRGMSMVYRAMVLKKLNRASEAAQVMQDAEVLLGRSEANPSLYWWGAEHARMALEEARHVLRSDAR